MKPRLQLKPKNKVKIRVSTRLVVSGAVFAVLIAASFFIYYNFGTSTDSMAGKETQLPGFSWRKKITLSAGLVKGTGELLNFPVLIQVKDPDLRSVSHKGKVVHPKGYDIRFSKKDGTTLLLSQIDEYNPATGEVSAWVLMDTLRAGIAAELFLYYSNATIRNELPNVSWPDSYKGIWHMNSNAHASNNRKIRATMIGTAHAAGKIGSGRLFSREAKDCIYFDYAEELDLKGAITVSAWLYLNETGREQVIVSNQSSGSGGYRLFITQKNQLGFDFISSSGKRTGIDGTAGGETLEKDRWYFVTGVYDARNNRLQTYIGGIADRTLTTVEAPAGTASSVQFGRDQFGEAGYFDGILDEIRISPAARDQSWLATEFYNQWMPGEIITLGEAEELQLDATSLQQNKEAMRTSGDEQLREENSANRLQAKKLNTADNPAPLSGSAEVIQARMNNIRRVSEKEQTK